MKKKILVTGASGFVGRVLIREILSRGHLPVAVVRGGAARAASLGLSPSQCIELAQISDWTSQNGGLDAVVHLSGHPVMPAGVIPRWASEHEDLVRSSRVEGTRQLVAILSELQDALRPKRFAAASAIGIYGNRGSEELTEDSKPGSDFLAQVCVDWERESLRAQAFATVCIFRIGLVMGPPNEGGMLARLAPLFKMGMGGRLGSGEHFMSWIDRRDLVEMLIQSTVGEDAARWSGIYNAVSPEPVTNREFTGILAEVLNRPAVLPVPEFALNAVLGKVAPILLSSQNVIPSKLNGQGFIFAASRLETALQFALKNA